jgi:homogentisate 1,2-dioxygenase
VAWVGNYYPYRYDLSRFCVVNSVSFDHLDPCIFCVLTSQTAEFGVAACDFVIFPPRFMVQEKTFRPPYYHKNCMSEFMGNIRGVYEAKEKGFLPGGGSLHNTMAAHGPEAAVFEKASNAELVPVPPNHDHLAFMFESYYTMKLTDYGEHKNRDVEYPACWDGIQKHFDAAKKP